MMGNLKTYEHSYFTICSMNVLANQNNICDSGSSRFFFLFGELRGQSDPQMGFK